MTDVTQHIWGKDMAIETICNHLKNNNLIMGEIMLLFK